MRLWPRKRNGSCNEDPSRLGNSILSAPGPDDAAARTRSPAWSCEYCAQARPPYVYSDAGKAYCVPCAHMFEQLGTPVGAQRSDDADDESEQTIAGG